MEISVTEKGMAQAMQTLIGVAQRADDIRPAFVPIQRSVAQLMTFQFNSEGQFLLGHRWKELAPSTARKKAKAGLDPRILWAKHDLRNSLTRKSDENNIFRVTKDSFIWGSELFYAEIHDEGSGKIPRRQIWYARPIDIWRWSGYIMDHIMGRDLKRRRL